MKLDPQFIPFTKLNSKMDQNLNIRAVTTQLLGENRGVKLCDLGLDHDFLTMASKVQVTG